MIPQLVAVQEDPAVEGLLVLINTVGGDVEAGLALAELIASISKPSATGADCQRDADGVAPAQHDRGTWL